MRKLIGTAVALAILAAGALYPQDIAGSWQGTLKAGRNFRLIVEITKGEHGVWNAMLYPIDEGPDPIRASSLTLEGSAVKLTVDATGATYEGTLSADGNSIKGTWKLAMPRPLELARATKETAWKRDASPHTIQFVAVDKDVKLEVLDWGGSGRPLVFLAGLGNTAHIFDDFAPKLAGRYHVYGITRRGFGTSSMPAPMAFNYTADRLGDDVLAVCAALKLEQPVLAGHSIAGEELSSVGSRHPERVAGLIYLDAGDGPAFYDSAHGDLRIDSLEVQKKLDVLFGVGSGDPKVLVKELIEANLPRLEKDLREMQKDLEAVPSQAAPSSRPSAPSPTAAIIAGEQKYTGFRGVPVLAIFALPHETPPNLKGKPAEAAARDARELETGGARMKAFGAGIEGARVVALAHANHYVFRSNEADVLREMNAFLAGLK
jgi:pimeloyl-ACP methyl ester carboxylesterase